MTEAQEQATLFKWARQESIRRKYPELKLLLHIPNGGSRDLIEGKHLKQQGVKAGVPDLILPVPRGIYAGMFIEMKTEFGKTTLEQDWWLEQLRSQGYSASVCHGWRAAARTIEWYLSLKGDAADA